MEEIGKLIRELFNDLKGEKAKLTVMVEELSRENREMAAALARITEIIASLVTHSHQNEYYMQSLWGREFEELINLLGIELKEEEDNDTV